MKRIGRSAIYVGALAVCALLTMPASTNADDSKKSTASSGSGKSSSSTTGGGRRAFAEFTEVYQIEADLEKRVAAEFNKMIESAVGSGLPAATGA